MERLLNLVFSVDKIMEQSNYVYLYKRNYVSLIFRWIAVIEEKTFFIGTYFLEYE